MTFERWRDELSSFQLALFDEAMGQELHDFMDPHKMEFGGDDFTARALKAELAGRCPICTLPANRCHGERSRLQFLLLKHHLNILKHC